LSALQKSCQTRLPYLPVFMPGCQGFLCYKDRAKIAKLPFHKDRAKHLRETASAAAIIPTELQKPKTSSRLHLYGKSVLF